MCLSLYQHSNDNFFLVIVFKIVPLPPDIWIGDLKLWNILFWTQPWFVTRECRWIFNAIVSFLLLFASPCYLAHLWLICLQERFVTPRARDCPTFHLLVKGDPLIPGDTQSLHSLATCIYKNIYAYIAPFPPRGGEWHDFPSSSGIKNCIT